MRATRLNDESGSRLTEWRPSRRRLLQLTGVSAVAGVMATVFPELRSVKAFEWCLDGGCQFCCDIDGQYRCGEAGQCWPGWVIGGCSPYWYWNEYYVKCNAVFNCATCYNSQSGPYTECTPCCGCCPDLTHCSYCQRIVPCGSGPCETPLC